MIPIRSIIPKITKILKSNNRMTMDAFKIYKGECDEGMDRIHIRIKNNKLFWIHIGTFEKQLEKIGFTISWLSRDSFKNQKTQCTLTVVRRKNI